MPHLLSTLVRYPYRKNVDQGTEMLPGSAVTNLGDHRDAVQVKPLLWLVSREQVRRRVDVHNAVADWPTHMSELTGAEGYDEEEFFDGGESDQGVRRRKRHVMAELLARTGAFTGFRSLQRKLSGIRRGSGRPQHGPALQDGSSAADGQARIAGGSAVPVGLGLDAGGLTDGSGKGGAPDVIDLPDGHISRKSLAKIDFRFDELAPAASGHDAQRIFREAIDMVTNPAQGGNPEHLYEVREEMHCYGVEGTTSPHHYVRFFEKHFGYELMMRVMPLLVSLVKVRFHFALACLFVWHARSSC